MRTLLLFLTIAAPKYVPFATRPVQEVQVVPHDYGSKWADALGAGMSGASKGMNTTAQTSCTSTTPQTNCNTTLPQKTDTPEPTYQQSVATIVKFDGHTFTILNKDKKATFQVGKSYTIWTDSKGKKFYLISDEGQLWEANETKK